MGVSTYDLAANYVVCTSTTRPSGADVFAGLMIFETDTQYVMVYDGTAWHGTNAAKVPSCFVYRNAALTINNNTVTPIDFDGEISDSANIHAAGVFTVPAGWSGAWLIAGGVSYPFNSAGRRIVQYTVNAGTANTIAYQAPIATTFGLGATGSMIIPSLAAGDAVRMVALQDSGANLALNVGNSVNTYAKFTYLGWT